MRQIEYRGPHDLVDVPLHQLGEVPARTPIEVDDDVAADLTADGTSPTWVDVTPEPTKGAKAQKDEA